MFNEYKSPHAENFFIHLVSNANHLSEENTLDKFVNHFPFPLQLPEREKWGVALHALYMPNSPAFPPVENVKFKDLIHARQLAGQNSIAVHCKELSPRIGERQPLSIHTRRLYQTKRLNSTLHVYEPRKKQFFRIEASYIQRLTIELTTLKGKSLKIAPSQPTILILEFKKMSGETYSTIIKNSGEGYEWFDFNTRTNFRLSLPAELSPSSAGNTQWEVALASLTYEPYFDQLEEIRASAFHAIISDTVFSEHAWAASERDMADLDFEYGQLDYIIDLKEAFVGRIAPPEIYRGQAGEVEAKKRNELAQPPANQEEEEEEEEEEEMIPAEVGEEGEEEEEEEEGEEEMQQNVIEADLTVLTEEEKVQIASGAKPPRMTDHTKLTRIKIRIASHPTSAKTFFSGDWRGGSKYKKSRSSRAGYYKFNASLVAHFKNLLKKVSTDLRVPINLRVKQNHINLWCTPCPWIANGSLLLVMHYRLAGMLGFGAQCETHWNHETTHRDLVYLTLNSGRLFTAHARVNVNAFSPDNIMIYANFVEPSLTGNINAAILKSVPVIPTGESGFLHYEPRHLEFRRIAFSQLNNLHFQLSQTDGKEIKFAFTDVDVRMLLEFRRK
jgi:hypothetical protein